MNVMKKAEELIDQYCEIFSYDKEKLENDFLAFKYQTSSSLLNPELSNEKDKMITELRQQLETQAT